MKINHMKNLIFAILLASSLWVFPQAQAASIIFSASSPTPANRDFKVDVMIDASGENLNAFGGTVSFPNDLLRVKEMNDGDSIVNFWLEKPHLASSTDPKDGAIVWSGITPQGFESVLGPYPGGRPGKLFSIVFAPNGTGNGRIVLLNLRALIGDGKGSPANVTATPFYFSISGTATEGSPVRRDLNPPEGFRPEIASEPTVWNGRYFLVFGATDKESGIDHYEVRETRKGQEASDWVVAESPYLLKDQKLSSFISVKAVDRSGNERVEVIESTRPERLWYENGTFWIIIMGAFVILGAGLSWKRRMKKWK